jgi:hypothetical protein
LHHETFAGDLGNVHTQQKSVSLQQKSFAEELTEADLLQNGSFPATGESSRLLKKGVL